MYIPFNETWERMLLATFHPFATNGAQRRFKMVSRCCSWSTTVCREREKCFCEHLSRQMFLSVVKNVFQVFFFQVHLFPKETILNSYLWKKEVSCIWGEKKTLRKPVVGKSFIECKHFWCKERFSELQKDFASHCFCLWLNWSINLFF